MRPDDASCVSGLAPAVGFEPTTKRLTARWLRPSTTQGTPRFSPAESVTTVVTACRTDGCERKPLADGPYCWWDFGALANRALGIVR